MRRAVTKGHHKTPPLTKPVSAGRGIGPHRRARKTGYRRELEVPPLVGEGSAQTPAVAGSFEPSGAFPRADVDGVAAHMWRLLRRQDPPSSGFRAAIGRDRIAPHLTLLRVCPLTGRNPQRDPLCPCAVRRLLVRQRQRWIEAGGGRRGIRRYAAESG